MLVAGEPLVNFDDPLSNIDPVMFDKIVQKVLYPSKQYDEYRRNNSWKIMEMTRGIIGVHPLIRTYVISHNGSTDTYNFKFLGFSAQTSHSVPVVHLNKDLPGKKLRAFTEPLLKEYLQDMYLMSVKGMGVVWGDEDSIEKIRL